MAKSYKNIPGVEWVEGSGDFIKVIAERCDGCADCVKVCLGGCYEIKEKKARIKSLNKCMECAACWYVCPQDAIDLSWPPGGTGFKTDWG